MKYLSVRNSVLIKDEDGNLKHYKECKSFDEAAQLAKKLNDELS